MSGWEWETGTPWARGKMVRDHIVACRGDNAALCDLFQLTEQGLVRILAGDEWRPEYKRRDEQAA